MYTSAIFLPRCLKLKQNYVIGKWLHVVIKLDVREALRQQAVIDAECKTNT